MITIAIRGDEPMIDITGKESVFRETTAEGRIRLKRETIDRIRRGGVVKGDVLEISKAVAIQAVKDTYRTLPFCHPLPITGVDVDFDLSEHEVTVRVTVRTMYRTGVEMEALNGVIAALLNIWDMVKYLEKEDGDYRDTEIFGVRVIRKRKGDAP